eukprot:903920-Pleurochrysis_carterae.AAC.1
MAAMEDEEQRFAVDILFRAMQYPIMQVRTRRPMRRRPAPPPPSVRARAAHLRLPSTFRTSLLEPRCVLRCFASLSLRSRPTPAPRARLSSRSVRTRSLASAGTPRR